MTLAQPSGYPCPIQAVRPNVGKRSQIGFCEFTKPDFGQDFSSGKVWQHCQTLLCVNEMIYIKRTFLIILSKAKNNRICSHRMKSMIGETVKKGGFNHRQAKRQPKAQNRTYPGFPWQDDPCGVCIPRKRTLFTGGQIESSNRPGNSAEKTVRVVPDCGTAAVWEKRWISGPFWSIIASQCSERFD